MLFLELLLLSLRKMYNLKGEEVEKYLKILCS